MSEGYKHVCLDERVQIEKWRDQGTSMRQIAVRLGRNVSTVSREIAHRSWRPGHTSTAYTPWRPAALRTDEQTSRQYRASRAQHHADQARSRSHRPWRMTDDRLVGWVVDRLRRGWTPEEISGRLPIEFGDDPVMRVGTETLYAWIYSPTQRLRRLWGYLPRGHKRRRHRGGRRVHSDRIKWRTPISQRPGIVDERVEFGHWEADSVLGLRGTGAVHTEVERVSRFYTAIPVSSTGAAETVAAQIRFFSSLPAHAVRSVTADNGTEFARHWRLADALAVPTYFADPYSAWQRGSNEHFNGRLRRYLPKGTDFSTISPAELADILAEINNRPRKVLDWRTPAEVFEQLCSTPPAPRCTSD